MHIDSEILSVVLVGPGSGDKGKSYTSITIYSFPPMLMNKIIRSILDLSDDFQRKWQPLVCIKSSGKIVYDSWLYNNELIDITEQQCIRMLIQGILNDIVLWRLSDND